jgi:hypothetical protein
MAMRDRVGRLRGGLIFLAVGAVVGLLGGTVLGAQVAGPRAVAEASPDASIPATESPSASTQAVHYQGTFDLQPTHGIAGTVVRAVGSGFAPGASLELDWNTVEGSWVLSGTWNESFEGRTYKPTVESLTQVTTDGSGAFTTSFTAPDGFGFSHDVAVTDGQTVVNKAAFKVDPQVSISPTSGPPGTLIHLVMRGVGWANLENSWLVTYDDQFTGWLSAVTTDGLAEATIPATGGPGEHIIRVAHGAFSVPYLNNQQSPEPDRPTFTMSFTVTSGEAVPPPAPGNQSLAQVAGAQPAGGGPQVWADPQLATVGTPVTIHGAGFPASASVGLTWSTIVGNRVSGSGYDESSSSLGTVSAADGSFQFQLPMPDDLGGTHRLDAVVGDTALASTTLTITPSAYPIEPAAGPPGTDFTIHLKGVGWTETANIYTLVYDNGYLGYACGFNSQGDVQIHLAAAGPPGWHFIDLYPAIYKGKDIGGVYNFRIPELTFAADHPGEQLPAFHFAFQITGP